MQGASELLQQEDFEDGFKKLKGGFKNREMMMGSTIRDLGNTIKEAKKSKKAGELQFSNINADEIQDEELEEEGSYLDSQRPVSDIMLGADDNISQI
jgi:hypothetical protein